MSAVKAPIETGVKWTSFVMGLLLLAFLLYIVSNGSISKYKILLFGN